MPLFEHQGKAPRIDPSAYVAPTATLVGDVEVGPGAAVLFGAVLSAEGGPIRVGSDCIVMENAVLRGLARHPLVLGNHVLVGPLAHLTGCSVEEEVFIATGACIFNGAVLESGSIVKIQAIVHIRSRLSAGSVVPIGWIAVGDPAKILPPHEDQLLTQGLLERNFRGTVFGLPRDASMSQVNRRYLSGLHKFRHLTQIPETRSKVQKRKG